MPLDGGAFGVQQLWNRCNLGWRGCSNTEAAYTSVKRVPRLLQVTRQELKGLVQLSLMRREFKPQSGTRQDPHIAKLDGGFSRDGVAAIELSGLQLVEDFPEFPRAGFIVYPFGPSDRAQRKAASRIGIVPQFQDVIFAGRRHGVLTVGVANAVRFHWYLDARAYPLDDLFEGNCRT